MKKGILRLGLILLTIIYIMYNIRNIIDYDLILFFILIIGMFTNYFKKKYNALDAISNYIFWAFFAMIIFLLRNEELINFQDSLFLVVFFKLILVLINYYKFKKVLLTSTILTKLWFLSLLFYLSELLLNSTHGSKSICLLMGWISTNESLIIILKQKEWKLSMFSFFNVRY